jgi:hypothetical protein
MNKEIGYTTNLAGSRTCPQCQYRGDWVINPLAIEAYTANVIMYIAKRTATRIAELRQRFPENFS